MRFVLGVLLCAVLALAQPPKSGPSPEEAEIARLQGLADQVKDALATGHIAMASKLADELGAGISHREEALKLVEVEMLLPAEGTDRIWRLGNAAKTACDASDYAKAETYASELLSLAEQFPKDPQYGHAVFYGNMVMGRVALGRDKNIPRAKAALTASGQTPGSPVLKSFGPNMSLAKDLLAAGERDVVLQFFEQCRAFWKMDAAKLDEWIASVKGCCRMPDFPGHLL